MKKLLTIDCWNTLIKPSGDKERVIYKMSRKIGVPYAELWSTVEALKKAHKDEMHKLSNYVFWYFVKDILNLPQSTTELVKIATHLYKEYKPQYINYDMWCDVICEAIDAGYGVSILSNTGYLKSDWLEKYFKTTLDVPKNIPVIGSDLLGTTKPNLSFYRKAVDFNFSPEEDKWIHIGDSPELDIKPVEELGGKAILFTGWDTFDDTNLTELFS